MPIKKDGTGKRWVEMELVVPGTPEQIWQALATGPGVTAWFTKTTIEERVGGALRFDFGAMGSSAGEVTTWEPPRLFGYVERDWSPGAPPVATEVTITGRSGDRCLIRMVHSLFSSTDDWDDQLEGFEKGWPAFFDVLRLYLAHFAGRPAASFTVMTSAEGDHLTVWKRLTEQLALTAADAGEQRTTASQPEALSGAIERVQQQRHERYLLMRLDAPTPGVVILGTYAAESKVNVSMTLYVYGDDAAARAHASEQKWQAWLSERFASTATSVAARAG
jgi:uncharacterized protein YndB with AHSA1/START domain